MIKGLGAKPPPTGNFAYVCIRVTGYKLCGCQLYDKGHKTDQVDNCSCEHVLSQTAHIQKQIRDTNGQNESQRHSVNALATHAIARKLFTNADLDVSQTNNGNQSIRQQSPHKQCVGTAIPNPGRIFNPEIPGQSVTQSCDFRDC